MKSFLTTGLICLALCAGLASTVSATLIHESATLGPFGIQGITFTNGGWVSNFGLPGSGGPLGLGDTITDQYRIPSSNPIVGVFNMAYDNVSISASDVGGNGVKLVAYDAVVGGSVVGMDQIIGVGFGFDNFGTLSIAASNIWRIELFQPLLSTLASECAAT